MKPPHPFKTLLFVLALLLLLPVLMSAQSGFRYQAVVRDNAGAVIASQTIGLRLSVLQGGITGTVVYSESHSPLSNAYGVVQVTVGGGTPLSGDFDVVDWSLDSYLKVEVDPNGGTAYTDMGTSQLLAVPKAMYAEKAKGIVGAFGLNVKDFGAVGDDSTDDTAAFNAALAAAVAGGRKVFVPEGNYKITSTLTLPDGVTLVGEGVGSAPLAGQYNGSAIRYYGSGDFAIQLTGHTSGIRDMVIKDMPTGTAAGAVRLLADGELLESCRLHNLLLFDFTGGTALKLESINGGGIAYCSFYNVRIRHAKTGIHITEDGPSFTNSNLFMHGAVSGGGYDYCLLVDGGNNNQFYGTVFEPYTSTYGHLVVNEGEVQCHDIRIEGNSQPSTVPLVECKAGTRNSYIGGTYAGGLTLDRGNNRIAFRSGKAAKFRDPSSNLFDNATFQGFDGTALPSWMLTDPSVGITEQPADLLPSHKVIKLTVPAGLTAQFRPVSPPQAGNGGIHGQVNFGFYVKVAQADAVFTSINSPEGMTVSAPHGGDGTWQYVGMASHMGTGTNPFPQLWLDNSAGGAPLEVWVTCPAFAFGNSLPDLAPKPLSTAGGQLNGTLSQGMQSAAPSAVSPFEMFLSNDGNLATLSATSGIIARMNYSADRFPKGTVITLLFENAGVTVQHSAFILLKNGVNFNSVSNSSLILVAMGDGTWREVGRND